MFTNIYQSLSHILHVFGAMVWQIYWPLAFGLILSSLIRNILPVDTAEKYLGHTSPKSLGLVALLGMVSSSCSYAAASLTKTLLIKKASLANAMGFLVASTNLIMEMFIVLISLFGWQFLWGEITGGLILIVVVSIIFQFYPKAQKQALRKKLAIESMPNMATCHMTMPMDVKKSSMNESTMSMAHNSCNMKMDSMTNKASHQDKKGNAFIEKISQSAGYFQMDIAMIGKEILIGVVISSVLIALMPVDWWRALFIGNNTGIPSLLHSLLDVVIGICVAVLAYVCSVGNLLLAAALWHGGISFGGVMGFILADVLTIPMTHVYRNYYGKAPARWMVGLLFVAILITGVLLDLMFGQMDWTLSKETIRSLPQTDFGLNFTSIMNLIFIPLSIVYFYWGKKINRNSGMKMTM